MQKNKEISIQYSEHEDDSTLKPMDQKLLKKARASVEKAYAPYSKFKVGAALITRSGTTITGANQENASFPIGACAERVALYTLSMDHKDEIIEAIAVTASSAKDILKMPVSPCGSCRQLLVEIENQQIEPFKVILAGEEGPIYVFRSAIDLLPFSFDARVFHGTSMDEFD